MSTDDTRALLRAAGVRLIRAGKRHYRVEWGQLREALPEAAERVYAHFTLDVEGSEP